MHSQFRLETFGIVLPFIGVFPSVRSIFKRERNSGTYRASTAFFSKVASNMMLAIGNALVFSIGIYFMVGLQGKQSFQPKLLTFY